jgi:hypothetical protein
MRHGRAKQTRKTLQFYERTIPGFQRKGQPYHIILDGTFIVTAMKYRIPLYERVLRLLGCNTNFPIAVESNYNDTKPQLHKKHGNAAANPNPLIKPKIYFYVCTSTITELQSLLVPQQPQINTGTTADTQLQSTSKAIEQAIAWCQANDTKRDGYELILLQQSSTTHDKETVTTANTALVREQTLCPAAADIWHHLIQPSSSSTSLAITNSELDEQPGASTTTFKRNNSYYMIATQDLNLLHICRSYNVQPIPIIRFGSPKSGCVLLLDPPSHKSTSTDTYNERKKWFQNSNQSPEPLIQPSNNAGSKKTNYMHPSQISSSSSASLSKQRQVVKKAKGPNPLSCKKKRMGDDGNTSSLSVSNESKRKRQRRKNPKNDLDGTSITMTTNDD